MVDEFLLNWLGVTSAALPDIHLVFSALALALYLSLVSLAAAYVTWFSFDRLLAY